jgi:hypothetical protein
MNILDRVLLNPLIKIENLIRLSKYINKKNGFDIIRYWRNRNLVINDLRSYFNVTRD